MQCILAACVGSLGNVAVRFESCLMQACCYSIAPALMNDLHKKSSYAAIDSYITCSSLQCSDKFDDLNLTGSVSLESCSKGLVRAQRVPLFMEIFYAILEILNFVVVLSKVSCPGCHQIHTREKATSCALRGSLVIHNNLTNRIALGW